MLYDSVEANIYSINSGHAGVYLSNICLTDQFDQFTFCNEFDRAAGKSGTLVQRYDGMMDGIPKNDQKDWIALPFTVSRYGIADRGDAPILSTTQTLTIARKNSFDEASLHIGDIFADVSPGKLNLNSKKAPGIQDGEWKYAVGTAEIRGAHLITLPTTPEEDALILNWLNTNKNHSAVTGLLTALNFPGNNCSVLANTLFKVAKGKSFNGRGYLEDAFLITPMSVAKEVKNFANRADIPYKIAVYLQTPGTGKTATHPGELVTDSNLGLLMAGPLHFINPASYIYWGLKSLRKIGLPLPGFKPYMDIEGKETKEHETDELAESSREYNDARKKHENGIASDLKRQIRVLETHTFGSKECWSIRITQFNNIIERAIAEGLIDPHYRKLYKMQLQFNRLLRLIPAVYFTPSHARLIKKIAESPGAHAEQRDHDMVLVKDGVVAGLTRNNISFFDQKLGFLVMTAEIVSLLDSGEFLLADEFDSDWKLMLTVGQNAGMKFTPEEQISIQGCSEIATSK